MVIDQSKLGRWRRPVVWLGLTSVCAVASPVYAQAGGAVTELSFSADVRHDENVTGGSANVEQRGLTPKDQRLTVGATLRLARPLGRNSLQFDAFVGYDFYRRNTQLNRERISFSGEANVHAGPCLVTVRPRFDRRQSELFELSIIDDPASEDGKNVETVQVYRGEVRCGSAGGIRPLVSYQRSWGDNSDDIRKRQNYRGEGFGVGVSYTNPILGDFSLSLDRDKVRYPNRPAGGPDSQGYRVNELRLTASRSIGAILVAEGYVAYSDLKPSGGNNVRDFKGVTWSVGATANPSPPLQLRASYSRALQPSLGADALYARNRDISARATYALSPRTSIGVSLLRAERDYTGARSIPDVVLNKDRLDQIVGRFDFKPNRRFDIGLSVGHQKRSANDNLYDYNNTYLVLSTRFRLGVS